MDPTGTLLRLNKNLIKVKNVRSVILLAGNKDYAYPASANPTLSWNRRECNVPLPGLGRVRLGGKAINKAHLLVGHVGLHELADIVDSLAGRFFAEIPPNTTSHDAGATDARVAVHGQACSGANQTLFRSEQLQ